MTTKADPSVLPFPTRQRPWGWARMGMWFLRLGSLMLKRRLRWEPKGFLLVLISEEDVDLYRGGMTPALYHDAVLAATDQKRFDDDRARGYSVSETIQEARAHRRERRRVEAEAQAAHDREYSYRCWCRRAFRSAQDLRRHQRTCDEQTYREAQRRWWGHLSDESTQAGAEIPAPLRIVRGEAR